MRTDLSAPWYRDSDEGEDPVLPLCAQEGLDPDTWFTNDKQLQGIAVLICSLCPYGPSSETDACYQFAMSSERKDGHHAYGIYGGRTSRQRQRVLDIERNRTPRISPAIAHEKDPPSMGTDHETAWVDEENDE